MDYIEKKISSEQIFGGKIIRVELDKILLPNGKPGSREVVRHNGGVAILAIDDADRVLFVRQYRYPYGEVLLELPAGKLEPGEDPAACGRRELEEETGYTCTEYIPLGKVYPSPGYVDEVLSLYLARGLVPTAQHLDEDEFLSVEKIPLKKAVELCLDGSITDAKTLVSILKYWTMRQQG